MQWAEWKARLLERSKSVVRQVSPFVKQVSEYTSTYFQNHKKQPLSIAAGLLLMASVGAAAQYYYASNVISVYHVFVNGKEIGVVNSPDVIRKWTEAKLQEEKAKHGLTLTLSDYITYQEEKVFKGKYDNEAAIQALAEISDIKVEAVKLVVDGKVVGYAADQRSAEEVLARLKQKYSGVPVNADKKSAVFAASMSVENKTPVKQVTFKEDVKLEPGSVPAAQVLSVDKLEQLLTKGTVKQVVHIVQEGDCISCIAEKYGITTKDIYANNPGITEDTLLQLGQQINVTANRPLVTVQVVEEVTREETIDYSTQIRSNDKLARGESKIVQEGREGSKIVRYQIVKENGQVVKQNVIDQKIVMRPITKIIERGTKVISSRGTGRLIWPARGYISSGFGMRWGKLHKGIDIAGAGPVRAADNGRVISAGWDGDYGKSIVIDHGNGLQTRYAHLSSIKVSVGDVVSQGKTIGMKGSTGHSTGVHLHFEVLRNGRVQNPLRYLN
jgi:murein DD-endopeptidase MepM/ murein hydrolase activator NlpD